MANEQSFCVGALVDMMNGKHALGASVARADTGGGAAAKDSYYGALYYTSASRGRTDTVYNTTGEVVHASYTAGGNILTTATAPNSSGNTAFWTPSASLVFTTLTAADFNCLLIYNFTSATKLALSVHTFGNQSVTAGNFTLSMPVNDATTGLIRFSVPA